MLRLSMLGLLLPMSACLPLQADVYADITQGAPHVVPAEYFGMHIHRLVIGPQDRGRSATAWPDVPLGAIRLWDARVRWADLARQPNDWQFERLDRYVEAARSRGIAVRYVLGSPPRWASARPDEPCPYGKGCSAEPARMQDWENYVRTVARRYKGRIACYELWNEPKFSDIERDRGTPAFYSGSVADMVAMARIARQVIKAEDPQAKLLSPGFVNGPDRLKLFLQAGGKAYIDGVAYHFYSSDSRRFASQISEVQEVMLASGVAHLPLYNTETGVEADYGDSHRPQGVPRRTPELAAAHVAQFVLLGAAAGLASYDFYAWDNDHSGAVDATGKHRPVHEVLDRVLSWLKGAAFEGCADRGGWVSCRGHTSESPFLLAWSDEGANARISPPSGYRFSDAQRARGSIAIDPPVAGGFDVHLDAMPVLFRFEAERRIKP